MLSKLLMPIFLHGNTVQYCATAHPFPISHNLTGPDRRVFTNKLTNSVGHRLIFILSVV